MNEQKRPYTGPGEALCPCGRLVSNPVSGLCLPCDLNKSAEEAEKQHERREARISQGGWFR